jgi:hypothetical protein
MRIFNAALAFAALVVIAAATPLTASVADPAISAPNVINNATIDPASIPPLTGVYDFEDQYKDSRGFPQPGWEFLTRPPR